MKKLKAFWHWLQNPEPPQPDPEQLQASYLLGQQNGFWSGVLKGRKDILDELEADLAARGRGANELEAADVARIKARVLH